MNNYEKLKTLTMEELAHVNVKVQYFMNGYRSDSQFITTDGNIFSFREAAEEYELKWLEKEEDKEFFNCL